MPTPEKKAPTIPEKQIVSECISTHKHGIIEEVDQLIEENDLQEAKDTLNILLRDPDLRCDAALYLFALDNNNREIINILSSEECEEKLPIETKLIKKILKLKRDLSYKAKKAKQNRKHATELENELVLLEQENARLKFELKKLEEIHRETERWRFK